jgi:hypothetical protein
MKRTIIYDIYTMAHNPLGCVAILITYGILGIPVLALFGHNGYEPIIAALLWWAPGILIGIHIGKMGGQIDREKKQFERWRTTANCRDELKEVREDAAWKILRSKDLNEYALRDLYENFRENGEIINSVLDKYSELKLEKPISYEKKD